ncbi:MAG: serine/threonine-protein kinase [Bryobacteraceae bacterium]
MNHTGVATLTAERWRRMESIFHRAIEVEESARTDFVVQCCAGDSALQAEVEQLLCAFHEAREATSPLAPHRTARRAFGEYSIDRELGAGGMGTVYLAHRADGQFEQQVALKVVSAHLRSQFFAERFRTERQILAQLNHPNITRLLDGGVSADGDLYLVMEYVDGFPIHQFCDARRLTVADRIRLLLPVCSAVEYAHRNLIVHRDLKPGNIFVTGEGIPKLLDFGTAKLLETDATDSTTTRFGMMTPRYASPEQLRGEPITTATDVYSLGVLLYELVSGAWPFGDPQSPITGLERAIKDIEPARPSSVITDEAARLRSESKSKLARLLEGDLSSVLKKAIDVDPRRRYFSVEHFSEDLQRYLQGEPVLARRQTLFYRSARFAQRNGWRLAAGVVVSAGLAFTALSALQQYGRNQQRMIQVRELSESYLTDVLSEVAKLPGSMKARLLIVDRARRNLDRLLADAPRDSDLRHALAGAYLQLGDIQGRPFTVSIGDTAGALASYRKAEALAADAGPKDWDLLAILVRARRTIAQIEIRGNEYPQAMALLQSALPPARRLATEAPREFKIDGSPAAAAYVETNGMLGNAMLSSANAEYTSTAFERALAQFRRTVAMAEELQAAHPGMADLAAKYSQFVGFALEGLGDLTGDRKYFGESAIAHRRTVEGLCKTPDSQPAPQWRRTCGEAWGELSWALHNAGDGEQAIPAAGEALTRMEELAKEEPTSAEAQQDLTIAYMHMGAAENAAARYREAIGHLRTAESRMPPVVQIPPNDTMGAAELYLSIYRELSKALEQMHDTAGAAKVLEEALAAGEGRSSVAPWEIRDLHRRLDLLLGAGHSATP